MSTKKQADQPTTVRENIRASVLREMTVSYDEAFQPLPAAITTAAVAAGAVAASATWGGDIGPVIPAAVGGSIGLMSWGVGAGMKTRNRPHRVAKGIGVASAVWGSLASWAVTTTPATWEPAGWLAAAAVGFVGLIGTRIGFGAVDALDQAHNRQIVAGTSDFQKQAYTKEYRPIVDEWQQRLIECGAKGVHITDVNPLDMDDWPAGHVFFLHLTKDATSLNENLAVKLKRDAEMVKGSSISFAEGETYAEARMVVSFRPIQKMTLIPRDFSPLSINDPLPLVVSDDAKVIDVDLRQDNILVGGVPGAGKSTFVDGLLTSLVRCTDVVIFGGNLAKPEDLDHWSRPDGTGILRLASNLRQLYAMLDAVEKIGEYRVSQRGGSKVQVMSPDWPQVVVILDEFVKAAIMSDRNDRKAESSGARYGLAERIAELQSAYRSAGIRFVLTATNLNLTSMGLTDIIDYSGVRLALTGQDRGMKALNKLAAGTAVPTGVSLTRGSGVLMTDESAALVRTLLPVEVEPKATLDEREAAFINTVMNSVAAHRPQLDPGSQAATGALWDAMRAPGEPLNPADREKDAGEDEDTQPAALHVVGDPVPAQSADDFQDALARAAEGDLSGFSGVPASADDRFKGLNLSALQG